MYVVDVQTSLARFPSNLAADVLAINPQATNLSTLAPHWRIDATLTGSDVQL